MKKMLDFRERTRMRRLLYNKPVIVLLLAAFALISQAAWGMYEKKNEAEAKKEKSLVTLEILNNRESELKNDIDHLSTDRGIEEEIRERFMVAKDGENVIIVRTPDKETDTQTIIVPDRVEKKDSVWNDMLGAVGLSGGQ